MADPLKGLADLLAAETSRTPAQSSPSVLVGQTPVQVLVLGLPESC